MLNRLPRDGCSEMAGLIRFQSFKFSKFQSPNEVGLKQRDIETESLPLLEKKVPRLLADAELADHGLVTLGIVFLEVVEQATALADQHEKSAARAVVFLVRLEVLRQLANALAEQSDLNFGTTGVARMRAVLVNEGFLLLSG